MQLTYFVNFNLQLTRASIYGCSQGLQQESGNEIALEVKQKLDDGSVKFEMTLI